MTDNKEIKGLKEQMEQIQNTIDKKQKLSENWELWKQKPSQRRSVIEGYRTDKEKEVILKETYKKEIEAEKLNKELDKLSKENFYSRDKAKDKLSYYVGVNYAEYKENPEETVKTFKENSYEVDV